MKSLDQFYHDSQEFIRLFEQFVRKHELVGNIKADHICYKCASSESFEHIRKLFEFESRFVYQSIISKRRIAIIGLKKEIETSVGPIKILELSDQKPDNSQQEGFDHIEIYAVDGSYEEMVDRFEKTEKVVKVERPHHTTHDIDMGGGFLCRCTHGPLVDKIKREEMV